jgi:hypothetical protein
MDRENGYSQPFSSNLMNCFHQPRANGICTIANENTKMLDLMSFTSFDECSSSATQDDRRMQSMRTCSTIRQYDGLHTMINCPCRLVTHSIQSELIAGHSLFFRKGNVDGSGGPRAVWDFEILRTVYLDGNQWGSRSMR